MTRISGVEQLNDDRIVQLNCQGPKGDCCLIVELTGRNSNLILTDTAGRIVDVLKRNSDHRNAPGKQYLLPEKKEVPFVEVSIPDEEQLDTSITVEKLYTNSETGDPSDLPLRLKKIMNLYVNMG